MSTDPALAGDCRHNKKYILFFPSQRLSLALPSLFPQTLRKTSVVLIVSFFFKNASFPLLLPSPPLPSPPLPSPPLPSPPLPSPPLPSPPLPSPPLPSPPLPSPPLPSPPLPSPPLPSPPLPSPPLPSPPLPSPPLPSPPLPSPPLPSPPLPSPPLPSPPLPSPPLPSPPEFTVDSRCHLDTDLFMRIETGPRILHDFDNKEHPPLPLCHCRRHFPCTTLDEVSPEDIFY